MPTNYLNTVFNINFVHEGEEISEDYLLHVPIGNYPSTLIDQIEAHVLEFIKRHGFTTPKDKARATSVIYFSASACPNLSVDQCAIHAKMGATHLLIDDIFDRSELFNIQHVGKVERMNHMLSKYFRCDAVSIDEDILKICPKFVNVCRMYLELGESLVATGKDLSWVYQGFDTYVGGNITQLKLPPPKSADEYLDRKKDNIGMNLYFDLTCLLAGQSLSFDVRNSGWFKEFEIVTAVLGTLCVDPISFNFETSEGVKNDNYTVILVQQGLSVKEAIKKSVTRYNQLFIKSLMLISQIDKMNISESDQRYLRLYFTVISAVFEWASHFDMYNNESEMMKYCEVKDEKRAANCVAEALRAIPMI